MVSTTATGIISKIALLAGCTLFVGPVAIYEKTAFGLEIDRLALLIPPAIVPTTFVATREVVKTIEDVEGDRQAGKETIATRLGDRRALQVVSLNTSNCNKSART